MRVAKITAQRHGLDISNHVFRLSPKRINFFFVSASKALHYNQVNEELCLLVRYSLAHIEQSVKHSLSGTEPFEILRSKILAAHAEHLIQMFLIVFCHSISDANSVYLMLHDLLVSQDRLFHDDVVRRLIISKLE